MRVSGPNAKKILTNLTPLLKAPRPRYMKYTEIFTSSQKKEVLDNGLVVYFPKEGSLTGEDLVEFHLHGGLAIVDHFLAELGEMGTEMDLR